MTKAGRPRLAALALLVALPLALRLAPVEHGLPANHVPDTHAVRNALGMARDRTLVPEVGRYSTYPYLLSYALLPAYVAQYALGRVTGEWASGEEFGRRLLVEPERAHRTARWLFAVLASLAPLVAFAGARAMGLREGAWFAAYLLATSLLHVHLSVQERPWAPLTTFLLLAAWPAARYATDGGRRALLASGAAAGLAFACHQVGLLALGVSGLAWLVAPRRRVLDGVLCVALFAAVSLALGHPYYLVHGGIDRTQVAAGAALGGSALTIGGQGFVPSFRAASVVELSRALVGYDPVLVLLALAGMLAAVARRASRPAALLALGWAAVFLPNQAAYARYMLPVLALVAWPAGLAAERAWRSSKLRWPLMAALALPPVQALRLGWVLVQEDTRAVATRALAGEGAEALAVDAHGPKLPLDRASLERLAGLRDLYARERHRLELFRAGETHTAGPGFDAVPLEALLDYDSREGRVWVEADDVEELAADPHAAVRALGCRYVLVVERTPGDGAPPLVLDPQGWEGERAALRVEGAPRWVVRPGAGVRDARLPAELGFALTDVWRLERPGPELALYRLAE